MIIDGRDVTALPMYRRARLGIGYLPQEVSIFRGLSVEENILAVLEITDSDRHKRRERLEELLSEFSITPSPAGPSTGSVRRGAGRVEIARCLAANPIVPAPRRALRRCGPHCVGEISIWSMT